LDNFRHLHLRNLRPAQSDAINEITQLLEAVSSGQQQKLKSLSLEDIQLSGCGEANTSVATMPPLSFGDYFSRFTELEALTVTTASPFGRPLSTSSLIADSLPSTLSYLALRMPETIAIDTWLHLAVRDCQKQLATLRILPVIMVASRDWEYSSARGAPSSEALQLIGRFTR
jgi:hypothetical protein